MSAYKDTFEANTFEANTFACGTWRGTATGIPSPPGTPTMEYALSHARTHYSLPGGMHYALSGERTHYEIEET